MSAKGNSEPSDKELNTLVKGVSRGANTFIKFKSKAIRAGLLPKVVAAIALVTSSLVMS